MNKKTKNISVLLLGIFCLCFVVSMAQDSLCYEFECDYSDVSYICTKCTGRDSVQIVSVLFNELNAANGVVFRLQGSSVFLIIDGQEGLFFGNAPIGNWNTKEDESERFTVKWDSLHCTNANEVIYQFEFVPYYNEENPYITKDGTMVYHLYYDSPSYYWTRSAGVIAFEGDWLFVRKDYKFLKECILQFR